MRLPASGRHYRSGGRAEAMHGASGIVRLPASGRHYRSGGRAEAMHGASGIVRLPAAAGTTAAVGAPR
ncbi:hypothetical protein VL23_18795 [Stenotrophomonas maltophilia]|uniref:Uncharacterized protein n=1 Tax=Stenotrophomonas maltophilia TaxID=40324 RepID=A0AB34TDW9_STEMA|nr:hypothetical protein VL23_18795 [Stenotrophomonas maltophilia]